MSNAERVAAQRFIVTKEYRRFAEFCDACRRYRYIGVCTGPPGVGKTLSARQYSGWDALRPWLSPLRIGEPAPTEALRGVLLYTPSVVTTPRRLDEELRALRRGYHRVVEDTLHPDQEYDWLAEPAHVDLLIVDEADRLKTLGLEVLRDLHDRAGIGLVLIGMPGLEKRLARYPQLYSRVGFVHQYRALSAEELRFILAHKWSALGLTFAPDDFTDAEALAAIVRITGGNFRLVQRLFSQIERVLEINQLQMISQEVVDAARESLVIGPTG
jgi:DNA transposition AAA+ family ATPase